MNGADVIDISSEAIFVLLKVATPLMMVSLTVGLVISLFQALTQIQEMTLTFVPKILALLLTLVLLMPFIGTTIQTFSFQIFDLIAHPPSG